MRPSGHGFSLPAGSVWTYLRQPHGLHRRDGLSPICDVERIICGGGELRPWSTSISMYLGFL
ncbi:hypothetical protein EJB05_40750 [Eragrostis curvula]|uniref:Uncharacterized protein n=1 Tax=Eragrostis curvula TaxID=38414 RepID=A0A5J9TPJ7_9POAL|nr:hypothetical protein EJB05_40750 [Eragrostis curvula]